MIVAIITVITTVIIGIQLGIVGRAWTRAPMTGETPNGMTTDAAVLASQKLG